ncbi:MAG: hypothetical protein JKY50_10725 [Oleispira sp.]|nr:hypothetical protein [Oleispira sp.]
MPLNLIAAHWVQGKAAAGAHIIVHADFGLAVIAFAQRLCITHIITSSFTISAVCHKDPEQSVLTRQNLIRINSPSQ